MKRILNLNTLTRKYCLSEYFKNTLDTQKNFEEYFKIMLSFLQLQTYRMSEKILFLFSGRSRDFWISVGYWQ